jgi:hypothetical protein
MRGNFGWLAVLLTNLSWPIAVGAEVARDEFDVVVYSATPAGICSAIAASREGAAVALLEPRDFVGGMMSSGLSFSDSNQMARESLRGIFEECHQRIEDYYVAKGVPLTYSVRNKDQRPWTYEPHVAESVFREMLREARVSLFVEEEIAAVRKEGTRIMRVTTASQHRYAGRVFIDASYEGDLMALAGVRHQIGREGRGEYGESLAGQQFPKPAIDISPFDARGRLLPLLTDVQRNEPEAGDRNVMTYSYRLCLTDDPAQRVPIERPAEYDGAQFELFRRYFARFPDAEFPIDLYPIPGGKLDGNNGIAKHLSLGLVGESWRWPDATIQQRREIQTLHQSYTHGLLWFLANDDAVPPGIQRRARSLGLAKDEFERDDHWPPMLYVREARRMIGELVLTQHDILTDIAKSDSIGVGSFPCDSHDCQRIATKEGGFICEGTIFPRHLKHRAIGQPYQIPYRCVIPRASECDNLLVPVCASATHVAMCSLRVEPTWMVLGESCGIAAAMIARQDIAAQAVPYKTLRTRLEKRGVVVSLNAMFESKYSK